MADYYFISQLPSLDGIGENAALPITCERFFELCNRFLGKKALREVESLTLMPGREQGNSGSALIDAWNNGERNLRVALARVRADKMKKTFDTSNKSLPAELTRVASTAAEMDNPMEAEKFLDGYRLEFLESLRPIDTFSDDYVFYYGLKLKLLMRIRKFDVAAGEAVYKKIYNSVLSGDNMEAI